MRTKRKAHSVVIMAIHLLINPSAFSITNPHFGSQLMFNKCIGLWMLKKSVLFLDFGD